jgi:FkbM family methyltransferase
MIDRERLRSLWFRAHRKLGLRIRVPVDGFGLVLDPHGELAGQLLFADYEHAERELVRRALRPGDVFADVGAHAGLFSVLAARIVGGTGRVYAFEPSSRTFDALRLNLRRNRVARIVVARRVALSDSDGRQAIQIGDARYSAWTSFGRVPPGTHAGVEEVETGTIDSLLRDGSLEHPFLLKLDVEGWELHVLQGGGETFARDDAPHLLVEFTDIAAEAAGSSTGALYDALVGLGYALFRYVDGDLVEEPRRDAYPYDNLVATKRPGELRERLGRQ